MKLPSLLLGALLALPLAAQVCPTQCPRKPAQCLPQEKECPAGACRDFPQFFTALLEGASSPAATREFLNRKEASVLHATGKLVSVKLVDEGYLGGAHGFRQVKMASFLRDGEGCRRLRLQDIVTEEQRPALEAKLREALAAEYQRKGATPPQSSTFPQPALTENFCYQEDGLHFFFNRYEIDCYAAGEFDVRVDWPLPSCAQEAP